MNAKRRSVIKQNIKEALIPAALREGKRKERVYASIVAQITDIGLMDSGLIAPEEVSFLEEEYKALVAGYKGVQVHFLFNLALGAYVQTFYIAEKCGARTDGRLHVMIPAALDVVTGEFKRPNPIIQEYFDYLYLPDADHVKMMAYMLQYHIKPCDCGTTADVSVQPALPQVDITTWSAFAPGSLEADGSKDAYVDYRGFQGIRYGEDELSRGMEHLRSLGITGEYVSFRNRVAKGGSLGGVRNGSTETYYKAVEYLQGKGIQCVYVGLNENEAELGNGIIDASKQYDARMDIFLHSQAKFFMGDHSGIISFSQMFNKPLILLNLPYFTMDGDAYGPTFYERDLLLPEKIYDTTNKKYLTIREMLHFEMEYPEYKDLVKFYTDNGYEFHKNTDDEILDVVMEMNGRLDGTWEYSAEDAALQEKYLAIMNKNAVRYRAKWCRARIGARFIRDNQWMLG
jgi:putative glycosyltransferase (TIGR04372 family)